MKTRSIFAILIALSMLLASCTTPTAVVVPTSAPTNTQPPAAAPTNTQAPVAEVTATQPAKATATQPAVQPSAPTATTPPVAAGEFSNTLYATVADYQAATGKSITKFNEAPMLADQVKAGTLPPIEKRLPKDVAVNTTREGDAAQYGGQLRVAAIFDGVTGVDNGIFWSFRARFVANDLKLNLYPDVLKGWEFSDDSKTLALHLRQGMKWSDGEPFTADDLVFWYEDILQNKEITPAIDAAYKPGDQLMGLKKIDDYTVDFTFAIPYPTAVEKMLTELPSRNMIIPAHFLKQYLPKYNPDAAALAKKEGQETWQLAVAYHRKPMRDTMAPTLAPFILKEVTSTSGLWVRNPYYWRVDPAGNQLPYVDTILASIIQDWSGVPTKVMAGEVDVAGEGLQLADYPVLKQNEAQGKYKVFLRSDLDSSTALGFALNYTVKDPVLKPIFNDLRFRQALSLAINRDDISQTIFFGKTVPFTAPASSYWPGYEDWEGTYYAEHDVAKANALLDDMGLKWDSAHQYRLRPDGKTLTILGEYSLDWLGYVPDFMQIVVKNWADIGVKLDPKFVKEETLNARWAANLQDVGISNSDGGNVALAHSNYPIRLEPPWHWQGTDCCAMSSYPWRLWLDTNGAQGEEPPQQIKDLYKLVNQWLATPVGTPEFTTLMNQIIKINVDNLYYFGTVSAAPTVSINNNRVGNLPPLDGLPGALAVRPWMNETIFIRP